MEEWVSSLIESNKEVKMTEKQAKIIEAAVEMFAEQGYSATSTSQIARKAGVAEGTIFRHYKTKKDLLISILAPTLSKFFGPFVIRNFKKVVDTDYENFEDFLRALMRNRLEFAVKNAAALKILIHELPFHPELRAEFTDHLFPRVSGRLEFIIQHFQERGELIELPPFTLMRMAASTMAGYILTRAVIMPESEWNDEEEIERVVQFIMHGLTPH
ncbi:TetR/AcrR family transcriptional regulator [Alicyclobacillus sp. SO9]|uniref:TetR/AcrR family transcriptional regulator n=1 Tax=Alicyclobacillus sp. SO9 TaxID=2665646 RepID=UPI0018E7F5DD|nr:TetR/AcrR family transcriptional regulator [Alicyclobacillus sp. SO9]QQE77207.1 TetR/AcrR family transcriptional regulator [Alicyclobacillus sp. SO9]